MSGAKQLIADGNHPLFDTSGMFYKEFPSDFRQVRFYSLLIIQKAPAEIREINLLEQQVSELIKNAVRHGNKMDSSKKVRVWASFSTTHAHLIVQDEGEGFQNLEKWNEFNRKRVESFEKQDFETLEKYFAFKTENSSEDDGGNALFAAVEYWDGGVVFNDKRNAVAVYKHFGEEKRPGIEITSE